MFIEALNNLKNESNIEFIAIILGTIKEEKFIRKNWYVL